MGDQSVRQFFSAPTRYLAESINKESEFEKPYLDDDRAKMHMDFPWPDWPTVPPIPPWPPLPPFDGPVPGLPGCAITCYQPAGGDCEEAIWCHPSIWCGTDMGCTLCSWEVEGATTGYSPHNSGVGGWGIDIWIDEDLLIEGKAFIEVCMTDPCDNLCCEDIEVTCKTCPADVAMTWDSASSDETIAQGNGGDAEATVAVADGLGPYTWSVSGTGFSMKHSQTEGVNNTLLADKTSCGTATITVTDYCEDTVTGYVRGAVGEWVPIAFTSCVISGAVTEGDDVTRIQDQYKLSENWSTHTSCYGACDCDSMSYDCTDYVASSCHEHMGCTQCLTHENGYCSTNANEDTPCEGTPQFCCCRDGDCDTACSRLCNRNTSKLEEWLCGAP